MKSTVLLVEFVPRRFVRELLSSFMTVAHVLFPLAPRRTTNLLIMTRLSQLPGLFHIDALRGMSSARGCYYVGSTI